MARAETQIQKRAVQPQWRDGMATSLSSSGLKNLLGPDVRIGCALGGLPSNLSIAEQSLLLEHFNSVTPENCMKPGPFQPSEGRFAFEEADALVEFAQTHSLEITGHCLAWHQQYPGWFFKDGEASASRELVLSRLSHHINTVTNRYRGRIKGWDVVNEAIADDTGMLRSTPWTQIVGEDFVEQAFRLAYEADPQAELYYNDFNIEMPVKLQKTLALLRRLLDAGVRVDGVGMQGHWVLDQVPYQQIEEAIVGYHDLGVKVMITELDIDIMNRPHCGADISWKTEAANQSDPYAMGCPREIAAAHAEQYGRLFELFAAHRDKLSRISFWGLHDGRSWLNHWPWKRSNHALLFDRECKRKSAFHEVVNRVRRSV